MGIKLPTSRVELNVSGGGGEDFQTNSHGMNLLSVMSAMFLFLQGIPSGINSPILSL